MIHYHGTPFSGNTTSRLALAGKHACVSFEHPCDLEISAELCQSFILDNGAFSAWMAGKEYDFDGFFEWSSHWSSHPSCDWVIAPDIIDGSEADNDALLLDLPGRISTWVPVWHLHEKLERLERLVEDWPRVAFGSSGDFSQVGSNGWWQRMGRAMDVATDDDGLPLAKFHGLRMLDPRIFSAFPFSSADSTNVARNIGIDKKWSGPFVPPSTKQRALVMIDRIESHAAASRWNKANLYDNGELFG